MDVDKAFEAEPLQSFSNRCSPDVKLLAKAVLGNHCSRRECTGDDHIFNAPVSPIGQRWRYAVDHFIHLSHRFGSPLLKAYIGLDKRCSTDISVLCSTHVSHE